MSNETDVRRDDVVIDLLNPAEGHERETRPAVVVQNDFGNANSSSTIFAPATGTC